MRLTIAARQSHLARHQAIEVAEALQKKHPHLKIEFHFRESLGDKHLHDPLWKMPERGVFTEDFVEGLLSQEFDLVVHSWKDLPVQTREGLELMACLPRADQRDLLLVKKTSRLRDYSKQKLVIYSSSPRRIYNIAELIPKIWPHPLGQGLEFQSVRGNIPTRIRKMLESTEVDGLILAKAALDRLLHPRSGEEWEALRAQLRDYLSLCDWMVLPLFENPTAAAQGAIVVEARRDRDDLKKLLSSIHCRPTFESVQRERKTLQYFGGGCHLALGISVIEQHGHSFLCVKGLTPENEPLRDIRYTYHGPTFAQEQLRVIQEEGVERHPLAVDTEKLSTAKALFVSRFEAWPQGYQPPSVQTLWAAGMKTWKKLAAQGVWVHGCAESMGLGNPQLEALAPGVSSESFLRLTHEGAVRQPTDLATYRLSEGDELQFSEEVQMYYWKSGKLAEKYFFRYPWLKEKYHSCGFGDSGEALKVLLASSPEKLFYFLNADEFSKTVVTGKTE